MKKAILLLVLLAVPCLAFGQGLTLSPSSPYITIGLDIEDQGLEIEPLTKSELRKLDAARKDFEEAQANLATVKLEIADHHGQSEYRYQLNCSVGTDTNVEIHGNYAFRTKRERPSCLMFTTTTDTIPATK